MADRASEVVHDRRRPAPAVAALSVLLVAAAVLLVAAAVLLVAAALLTGAARACPAPPSPESFHCRPQGVAVLPRRLLPQPLKRR